MYFGAVPFEYGVTLVWYILSDNCFPFVQWSVYSEWNEFGVHKYTAVKKEFW